MHKPRRVFILALALFALTLFAPKAASAATVQTCPDGEPVPVTTPGPAVAPIRADSAVRITVHAQVGGLGGVRMYDGSIAWKEGGFVRTDGAFIPSENVRRLLRELAAPMATQFDFSRAGLDRKYLLLHLDAAQAYLQQARSLSAARAAFDREYLNAGDFEDWVGSEFDPCRLRTVTDYYPHLSVTITAGARNIQITSGSHHGFMLPLWITDERGERPTFNPGLARAIATLLPGDAPLRQVLSEENAALNWGYAITQTPAVLQAIRDTGTTAAQAHHIASEMGLNIDYDVSGASWSGSVWLRGIPWVRYKLAAERSSPEAFAASLVGPRTVLRSLAKAHWLIDALRNSRVATATASDASAWEKSAVTQLYEAGRLAAGGRLAGDSLPATVVDVGDGMHGESRWFALDNGELLLYSFDPATTSFHFGKRWYDALAGAQTPNGQVRAWAVVSPAGALLQRP